MEKIITPQDIADAMNAALGTNRVIAPVAFADTKKGPSCFRVDCGAQSGALAVEKILAKWPGVSPGITFAVNPYDDGTQPGYSILKIRIPRECAAVFCAHFIAQARRINKAIDSATATPDRMDKVSTALYRDTLTARKIQAHGNAIGQNIYEISWDDLIHAAGRGDIGCVNRLLNIYYREDRHIRLDKAAEALSAAAAGGYIVIVQCLLPISGLDINARDKNGITALMKAADNGHLETVDWLLQQRAIEVNKKDKFGLTALIRAAANGHAKVVERLLAVAQIDVRARTRLGDTAESKARENGHNHIAERLYDLAPPRTTLRRRVTGWAAKFAP